MSKECPFQSKINEIDESRCIIPLVLRPSELHKYCSIEFGSWFCSFHNNEIDCPLMKKIKNWLEVREG